MKITITGSLGNVGKKLATLLLKGGHEVTVVSSNANRKQAIETSGATAAIGSINDASFLTAAFTGADAVFAMTPPNLGGSDIVANTVKAGGTLANAIKNAGVNRVVMLSSIGADLASGNGPIAGIHPIEQFYRELPGVAVTFLRAGFFYNNFYNDIPLIKGAGITGANYPADKLMPLVHPEDIAAAAAEALTAPSAGSQVQYIVSDVRTPKEVAAVLGAAIGKPDLPWVEFTDEQSLQGMTQAGVPKEIAGLYTEMGAGFRNGSIPFHFEQSGSPVNGKIKLEDFAREFAAAFAS